MQPQGITETEVKICMSSISEIKTNKVGDRYVDIRVHTTANKTYFKRYYIPVGWSKNRIDSKIKAVARDFERDVKDGKIETRKERAEREARERAEAEKDAELEAQRKAEEEAKIQTLRQYTEAVFLPNKTRSIKENTRAYIQNALDKRIYPVFGACKIDEITTNQLKSWILSLEASGLSASTINGTRNVLHSIFEEAVDDETISRNPLTKKVKRSVEERDFDGAEKAFSEAEIQKIKSCLKAEAPK